ncbi:hypothetical protein KR009_006686, partial [Drosophila setifemur]
MKPLLLVLVLWVGQICALHLGSRLSDDYDYDDDQWRPKPLKPAPWQATELPSAQESREAVVNVPGVGEIVGVRDFKTISSRPVNAFLGVRYGQMGGGLARFQAAQPSSFRGRINATEPSSNCAQFPELQRLREAENRGENVDDCLTLDIYAPEGANNLPVLVFVHGEMLFDGGSEEAQPDYVLEKDVLLVSINYRLAPFGFLSALSDELPGNVALSDLHLALEWLQGHLSYFGGDPAQVTLVGQAGGATLAHALSLSGRAANLFQRLILQSGTALNPYLIDEQPLEMLDTFARLARCPSSTASHNLAPLYQCLDRLSTSQLVAAFQQLLEQNEARGLSFLGGFKLVVGDRLGYLPKPPAALATNTSNALPMIVGAAKDASAFILSRVYDQITSLTSRNVSDYIDIVLRHTAPPSEHKIWRQWALREIFTPDQEHSASAYSVSQGLLELSNLILYRAPAIFSIQNSHRATPVYLYTFDYRGQHHRFGHLPNPLPFGVDASLSDDSVYLFPYPIETSHLNPVDRSLSRALVTMWVNFATKGVPNPTSGVWPRATSEYGPFLRFTNSRQNMFELAPHFGEGIHLPNIYGELFNSTSTKISTATTTTTTTTTTTSRPFVYNPYAIWQPQQPPQQTPQHTLQQPSQQPSQTWRPTHPAQEAQQQQLLRKQRLREQQERRQQQDIFEQQRREYQQRLQQQQERLQREKLLREQQQQRKQQHREEQERELREREQRDREQRERELQELEQHEREQQERELHQRVQQPSYEDYLKSQRENAAEPNTDRNYAAEQEREQQQRDQLHREQQQSEHDRLEQEELLQREREQRRREQQELDLREREKLELEQREREQRERNQREREQLEHQEGEQTNKNTEDTYLAYPTYEDYLRTQEREQPQESETNRNYAEELESEQQRRDQLQEEMVPQPEVNLEDDRHAYPSYEDYLKAQEGEPAESDPDRNYAEEQEREQQRKEQMRREQEQEHRQSPVEYQEPDRLPYPSNEEDERSIEEDAGQDGEEHPEVDPQNDPSNYASYEEYVRAQQKLREEEEERDRALREEEEQERAQGEDEEAARR